MTAAAGDAELLARGAAELGVSIEEPAIAALLRYLDFVYDWSPSAGLTTVPRGDAVRLHLLDSLAIVPLLAGAGALADLGSGAGFPGIVAAAALPELEVTLVESRRRKCSFLREAIREIGLGRCAVVEGDARRHAREHRSAAVVARAFVGPTALVELAAPMLEPAGRLIVMAARGELEPQALAAMVDPPLAVTDDIAFTLPGGTERRRLLCLRRPPL